MPIGAERPPVPLIPGPPTESVQQVTWNGLLLLTDHSDAAYKRVLGQLLGLALGATSVPPWPTLLRELAVLGLNGRRQLLVRAALDWSERRRRFVNWWLADVRGQGPIVGVFYALPEMVLETVSVQRRLRDWRLLDDVERSA